MDIQNYTYTYYTPTLFDTLQEIISEFGKNFKIKHIFYIEERELYLIQITVFKKIDNFTFNQSYFCNTYNN